VISLPSRSTREIDESDLSTSTANSAYLGREMLPKKKLGWRSSGAASENDQNIKTAAMPDHAHDLASLTKEEEMLGTIPGTTYQHKGIMAEVCRVMLESLVFLVQSSVVASTTKNKNIVRRCHAILKLWMSGHHILTGELDRTLERSEHLKHATLSVLHSLCTTLLVGM
jgi:hypothetical protein